MQLCFKLATLTSMRRFHSAMLALGVISLALPSCASLREGGEPGGVSERPLTIVAIGDAGEPGAELRANAGLLTNMYTGQHDGGTYDAMIFLGDNFYPTGLNVPVDEVDGRVKKTLGPFKLPFEGLGRNRVHAIPGNHDYYARNAIEASALFGLISIAEIPVGLNGRGNEREAALDQWTYHHVMPASVLFPLAPDSPDSVEFLFVDSALPLRTDTASWGAALDSLRRLLEASRLRSGIRWRVLCMHHPMHSLGEHGGYTVWNDETERVDYLHPCDRDSDAVGWVKNSFDPEDLCAEKYRRFVNALRAVIAASGAPIHLSLAAHDHSLQLLLYPDRDPDCPGCPRVHIISGAGSRGGMVRSPSPPCEFTSSPASASRRGLSAPGFVKLTFMKEQVHAIFFNAFTITPVDMGEGRTAFSISPEGRLNHYPEPDR